MIKLLVLKLTLFYISTNSGAVLQLHYCMGKVTGWDFGYTIQSNICSKCGKDKKELKKSVCCKDEKVVQENTVQKVAETGFRLSNPNPFSLPHSLFTKSEFYYSVLKVKKQTQLTFYSIEGVAVYIKNCVFRI